MTDIRNASLVLKTSDFTTRSDYCYGQPYTFSNGYINGKGSLMTWNNINLRTLLGDMYDKYNSFNICLNTISTTTANTIDPNTESKNIVLKMSGLPWINQSYDSKTLTNTNKTIMGAFTFIPSSSNSQYYYSNNVATFGKNQEICNITLEYTRVFDDSMSTGTYLSAITTYTGTALNGGTTLTLSAATTAAIVLGSYVTGAGIPNNTCIVGFTSTTQVTLSQPTTAALNLTAVTIYPLISFPNAIFIFDVFGINDDGDLPKRISFGK